MLQPSICILASVLQWKLSSLLVFKCSVHGVLLIYENSSLCLIDVTALRSCSAT